VVTAKAKTKIKEALRAEKKKKSEEGKELLLKKLEQWKVIPSKANFNRLLEYFDLPAILDLNFKIATGIITVKQLKEAINVDGTIKSRGKQKAKGNSKSLEEIVKEVRGNAGTMVIGQGIDKIDYRIAPCCNPIPGDDVCGFVTVDDGIIIHRTNCSNAIALMSNFAYRIVKAKWTNEEKISFLAGISLHGIDEVGIVNNITRIISNELNVNMRSLSFESNDGIFTGTIMVFVNDTNHLTELIEKLRKVPGVKSVFRMDGN
jgi:GTP pyrophosphokinase